MEGRKWIKKEWKGYVVWRSFAVLNGQIAEAATSTPTSESGNDDQRLMISAIGSAHGRSGINEQRNSKRDKPSTEDTVACHSHSSAVYRYRILPRCKFRLKTPAIKQCNKNSETGKKCKEIWPLPSRSRHNCDSLTKAEPPALFQMTAQKMNRKGKFKRNKEKIKEKKYSNRINKYSKRLTH